MPDEQTTVARPKRPSNAIIRKRPAGINVSCCHCGKPVIFYVNVAGAPMGGYCWKNLGGAAAHPPTREDIVFSVVQPTVLPPGVPDAQKLDPPEPPEQSAAENLERQKS